LRGSLFWESVGLGSCAASSGFWRWRLWLGACGRPVGAAVLVGAGCILFRARNCPFLNGFMCRLAGISASAGFMGFSNLNCSSMRIKLC